MIISKSGQIIKAKDIYYKGVLKRPHGVKIKCLYTFLNDREDNNKKDKQSFLIMLPFPPIRSRTLLDVEPAQEATIPSSFTHPRQLSCTNTFP